MRIADDPAMRALVVLAVVAAATPAVAEPVRRGLMIGVSLGAGGASGCDDCDRLAGGAAEVHVGWWLTPQWALSYEAWVFTGDATHFVFDGQGAALGVVTTRLAPRVWVKAGAGLAMYRHEDPITDQLLGTDMTVRHRGFGIGTGIGYELYQSEG